MKTYRYKGSLKACVSSRLRGKCGGMRDAEQRCSVDAKAGGDALRAAIEEGVLKYYAKRDAELLKLASEYRISMETATRIMCCVDNVDATEAIAMYLNTIAEVRRYGNQA